MTLKDWKVNNRNLKFQILYFGFIFLALLISACSSNSSSVDRSSVKFQQYYVRGEVLYVKHCSNCHQKNGTGLGQVYPPLKQSDYMDQNLTQVLCLMKHGSKGNLTVNGKTFVQAMPGVSSLTDLEIAEIATYIYNSWENEHGIVDVTEASKALSNCATSK